MGGDEFCLVLPNGTKHQAKEIYINRLKDEIIHIEKIITLSIGIVQSGPVEYGEPDELVHQADERMYTANKAFKSNV